MAAGAPAPAAPKPAVAAASPVSGAKPPAAPAAVAAPAKPAVAANTDAEMADITAKFEGLISKAPYEGVFINDPARLVEVATYVRDGLHFSMLSSITAVDYPKDGVIEVVYHATRVPSGGKPLCFKVRVPREDGKCSMPSLCGVYPGAEFQEREAYDLYGVRFEGNPDLRRILMWEGFAGWPMRKDWKEAYFEGETKPFETRWPAGKHELAEERVPWQDNVTFPKDFDPFSYTSKPDGNIYESMTGNRNSVQGFPDAPVVVDANGMNQPQADEFMDELKTDEIIVNMGPQHPSTHGVLRMVVKLDGETITDLKLALGYLHRNHEKIGERNTWLHNIPYTDRLDYICGLANEWGYVLGVERMMGITPTPRVEYLRILMAELTRIESHFWSIGFLLNDVGAFFTPALYFITERDFIIDLFESVAGSRLMCNYMRFGGVSRDFTEQQLQRAHELAFERLPRAIDELDHFLTENDILKARCIGVGYLPADRSVAYSLTGPCLRAAGVGYDVRKADPYGYYERFDWDVPVRYNADVYDRYLVRVQEMRESLKIVQQVLQRMSKDTKVGDIQAGKKAYNHRVPAGQTYARVETPKGELGFYLVSDGGQNPYRYHIRSSSFINLNSLKEMTVGYKVADSVVILGSLDIVLGEVDR